MSSTCVHDLPIWSLLSMLHESLASTQLDYKLPLACDSQQIWNGHASLDGDSHCLVWNFFPKVECHLLWFCDSEGLCLYKWSIVLVSLVLHETTMSSD
jgi:hypothetical protein